MLKNLSILFLLFLFGCAEKQEPVKFEKITFHTSSCYGMCDTQLLEIKSDKKIRLYNQVIYSKNEDGVFVDTKKVGYFTGTATDSSFIKLCREFNKVGIDSLNFDGTVCCDGVIYSLIIYYDGKKKMLQSMTPPQKAQNLLRALHEIADTKNLSKSEIEFEIETNRYTPPVPGLDQVKIK